MPIESNTGSDLGQKGMSRGTRGIKARCHGETRIMTPRETPRERMSRVIQAVRKKKK